MTRAQKVDELLLYASRAGREGLVFPAPARLDADRPWDESNASNAMRELITGAGFKWATPHTLRRTAITMLHESGKDLGRIADFAGHADPSMTMSMYLGRDFDGDKSDLAAAL
jgi:integrase